MLQVYLRNFPDQQPGEIYASAIKQAVNQVIGHEPRVTFDTNSRYSLSVPVLPLAQICQL